MFTWQPFTCSHCSLTLRKKRITSALVMESAVGEPRSCINTAVAPNPPTSSPGVRIFGSSSSPVWRFHGVVSRSFSLNNLRTVRVKCVTIVATQGTGNIYLYLGGLCNMYNWSPFWFDIGINVCTTPNCIDTLQCPPYWCCKTVETCAHVYAWSTTLNQW